MRAKLASSAISTATPRFWASVTSAFTRLASNRLPAFGRSRTLATGAAAKTASNAVLAAAALPGPISRTA